MAKFSPAQYHAFAYDALLALLQREHAVVWPEVEAKLAQRPYLVSPGVSLGGIDPHHLSNARRQLTEQGVIEPVFWTQAAAV